MEKWILKADFCKNYNVSREEFNTALKNLGLGKRELISEGFHYKQGKRYPVKKEAFVLTYTSYNGELFAKKKSGTNRQGTFLYKESFLKRITNK